jgi:hypothetical protein
MAEPRRHDMEICHPWEHRTIHHVQMLVDVHQSMPVLVPLGASVVDDTGHALKIKWPR